MNDVAEPPGLSAERILTGTILTAFPWQGERGFVSAKTIPTVLWTELVSAARQHGLAALLFAALSDTADPTLPAAPLAELRDIFLRSRMANRLANDALGILLDGFAKANVSMLVLKGAALSAMLYPEPGLRPFGDLDLMLHRAELARAQAVLESCDYKLIGERHEGFSETFLKSLNYANFNSLGPAVDLHWHLFAPMYYRRRISMDFFWTRPLPFKVAGRDAFALGPLPQLVHLAAHAGLHARVPLVWLYDISLWIERYGSEIDWDEFVAIVQELELAAAVADKLSSAVDWWSAPVPPSVLTRLAQTRSGAGARLVYTIYSSPHGGARALVDLLYQEGLTNKVEFATQLIFPSREYMEGRKPSNHRGGMIGLYAQRVWRITRFVTGSLWATLTRQPGNK